ncbi:hypothetical protein [Clostridium sp. BJN0001]|uniref:hypothetical protein n=1 Tax=Clostridium sp. BJN0001 TaxID=2930219 RepID=UPI001FD2476C|nr:hypothetical protein [Clostridium sp. BJN0001]
MDRENEYYISRNRIILYLFICIAIYIYRNISEISFSYRSFLSDNICYCVFIFILAIVISELKQIDENYYSELMEQFFLPLCLFCSFSFYNLCFYNSDLTINYFFINNEVIMFLEILFFYNNIHHEVDNNKIENKIVYMVVFTSFVIKLLNDSLYTNLYITLLHIADFIIIINFASEIRNIKLLNGKYINILKLFEYSIIPYFLGISICFIQKDKNIYMEMTKWNCIIYVFFVILAINKVCNFPCQKLFSKIEKENEYLDGLNRSIKFSNIFLEKSNNEYKKNKIIYYNLFKKIPYSLMIISEYNNRILYINSQFCNMFKIENKKKIINTKVHKVMKFINVSLDRSSYNAVMNINDVKKYVSISILDEYKILDGKVYLIKDITEKVKIKKVKKEIQNRKKQEILHIKFLDGVGNNIKNPVSILNSAVQVIKIYVKNKNMDMIKRYNNIIYNKCIQLQIISNNIIDNSKIRSGNLNINNIKCNIVENLDEFVNVISDYVKNEGYNFTFYNTDKPYYTSIDLHIVKKILLNMIYIILNKSITGKNFPSHIYMIVHNDSTKLDIKIASNRLDNGQDYYSKNLDDNLDSYLYINKYLAKTQNSIIYLSKEDNINEMHLTFLKGESYEKSY